MDMQTRASLALIHVVSCKLLLTEPGKYTPGDKLSITVKVYMLLHGKSESDKCCVTNL